MSQKEELPVETLDLVGRKGTRGLQFCPLHSCRPRVLVPAAARPDLPKRGWAAVPCTGSHEFE